MCGEVFMETENVRGGSVKGGVGGGDELGVECVGFEMAVGHRSLKFRRKNRDALTALISTHC